MSNSSRLIRDSLSNFTELNNKQLLRYWIQKQLQSTESYFRWMTYNQISLYVVCWLSVFHCNPAIELWSPNKFIRVCWRTLALLHVIRLILKLSPNTGQISVFEAISQGYYLGVPTDIGNPGGSGTVACFTVCCAYYVNGNCGLYLDEQCETQTTDIFPLGLDAGQSAFVCNILTGASQYDYYLIEGPAGNCTLP
jgi:hypothetical protein